MGIFSFALFAVLISFVSAGVIVCSSNSDCFSGFSGNEYCMNNNVFKNFLNSTCVNPGLENSYCNSVNVPTLLADCGTDSWNSWSANYCKDNNVYHSRTGMQNGCRIINTVSNISGCFSQLTSDEELVHQCFNGCLNGVCNGGVVNCSSNSECGISGFTDGLICQNNNVFGNYITYTCNNAGQQSSYCSNSTAVQLDHNCLTNQVCNNGACNNQNIICTTITDCGTNGYVGALFCQNGNVFQNFTTYSCINPGTAQSYCNNFTAPLLKQTCSSGQTCSNGVCVTSSINCTSKTDCGRDSYVGEKFCDNDNVFQDYRTFTCNNPGTVNSYCSNNIISKLLDECSRDCSDGECTEKEHSLNPDYGFNDDLNDTEKNYVYPRNINFDAFVINQSNESVQKITGNAVQVGSGNTPSIFGNNLLLILIILIIIVIILIIIFSLMR